MAFLRVVNIRAVQSNGLEFLISSDNFYITADIVRKNNKTPGQAEVEIKCLTEDTFSSITQPDTAYIIEAGYKDDGVGVVFKGRLINAWRRKNDTEYIVRLELAEGTGYLNTYVDKVYPVNQGIRTLLVDLAKIARVNLIGANDLLERALKKITIKQGAYDAIIELAGNYGYATMLQDSDVLLYLPNAKVNNFAIELNVQSKEVLNFTATVDKLKGEEQSINTLRVEMEVMMLAIIKPNIILKITGSAKDGNYRVTETIHKCNVYSEKDYLIKLEAVSV